MTQEDMESLVKLVDSIKNEISQGFNHVETRFTQIDARLDRMTTRLDRIGGLVNGGGHAIEMMKSFKVVLGRAAAIAAIWLAGWALVFFVAMMFTGLKVALGGAAAMAVIWLAGGGLVTFLVKMFDRRKRKRRAKSGMPRLA